MSREEESVRGTVKGMVQTLVDKHGFAVMNIFPGEGDNTYPFNYTVGLTKNKGMPELIVIGLQNAIAHEMIHRAVEDIEENGLPFDGKASDQVLQGFSVIYRALGTRAAAEYTLASSAWYGRDVPYFQIVWPDEEGNFPWNPECNPVFAERQCGVIDYRRNG